jgi:hypothetical protein
VLNRQSEKIFELNLLHDFHAALSISLLQLAERYSLEPHTVSEQDSVIIQAIIRCDYQQFIKSCIQKFNLKEHYQLNADLYNLSNDQVKVKTYEEVYAILDQKIRNVRLFVDIDGVELHVRPTILVFHHLFRQLQNPKEFKKFLNAKLHMTYFEAKAECMYRNNPDFQRELLKISIKQEYNVDLFAFNSELEVLD